MNYTAFVQYMTEEGFDGEHEVSLSLTPIAPEADDITRLEKFRLVKAGVLTIAPCLYVTWAMTISHRDGTVVAYFESDGTEELVH